MNLAELVNQRILSEAGVDIESRPLLAFFACFLPNPKTHDYDLLLEYF